MKSPGTAGIVGFFAGFFLITLITQSLLGSPFGSLAGLVGGVFCARFMYREAHRRRDEGLDFARRRDQDEK